MPGCANPYLGKAVAKVTGDETPAPPKIWRPISRHVVRAREKPVDADEAEARRSRRDLLAQAGNARYGAWHAKNPPATAGPRVAERTFHRHQFRERQRHKELGEEWASGSQVLSARDRIAREVENAAATFLKHPPYPKLGGGVKNTEFSFMSAGYDYRQRQPSKEVAGTWSILRVRPATESARINEAVSAQRLHDLGGARWSIDQKYGNPPSFNTVSIGDTFRQHSPEKWVASSATPPPPSPNSRVNKWRGGFANTFPPSTADADFSKPPWMHHTIPFEDKFHETVAVNTARGSPSFRPERNRTADVGDSQFSSTVPRDEYVPNGSLSCTWNILKPSSPIPQRAYPKSITGSSHGNSPRGGGADGEQQSVGGAEGASAVGGSS